jgi:phosphatidylglycerophosphate synthase
MRGWALAFTVVRAALALPLALSLAGGRTVLPFALVGAAALTDLLDGPVARRRGIASAAGGMLDVLADAAILLTATGALAALGVYPVWVPLVLVMMLAQFIAGWRRGRLSYDPVGRYFGGVGFGLVMITLALPDAALAAAASLAVAGCAAISLAFRFAHRWRGGPARAAPPGPR